MAAKKIPHFMSTIMNTNSRDKRLRVPKTFMDKHGKHLSDQIHLKLPGGLEWEVKLRRCAGEVWFEKGWPEFSVFCSLDLGSCLVFGYEGKSKFHVLIFDESGTEIEYPTTMPQIEETDDDEEEDDDVSVEEILETEEDNEEESDDMSVERLENETNESLEVVLIDEEDDDDDVKSVEILEFFPLPQEKNRGHPHSSSKPSSSSSSSLRANVKAADKFVSSHPFFKVALGPSLTAHVPASFRNNFPQMKKHTVKLWIGDRSWGVTLNFYPQSYLFSAGWRSFLKANWLKEGDICIFELVDGKNLALEVKIFRC